MKNSTAHKLRQVPPGYLIMGIDPHKKIHVAAVMTQDTIIHTKFKIANFRQGYEQVMRSARDFLRGIFEIDIFRELDLYQLSQDEKKRKSQFVLRQKESLFQSLKHHTTEGVRWEVLNEWERTWNACTQVLAQLRVEASEMVPNFLKQESNLIKRIKEHSREEQPIERLAEAMIRVVLDAIWQSIVDGKFSPECPEIQVSYELMGRAWSLRFADKSVIEEAAKVCTKAANTLCRGLKAHLVSHSYHEVGTMRNALEELGEMLNPLKLRPIILRTRCDLCPA